MRPFRITPCKKPRCLLFLPRTDQCHAACFFCLHWFGRSAQWNVLLIAMQPHSSAVTALRSSNEHLHYKQCNYLITNGQLYGPCGWHTAWPNVITKKLLIGHCPWPKELKIHWNITNYGYHCIKSCPSRCRAPLAGNHMRSSIHCMM